MKHKVCSERMEALKHLKTRIRQAISSIDNAALSNVRININIRINCAVRQEGKHIEQIDF